MVDTKAISKYLDEEFLKFEARKGRRSYVTQFADWLDVSSASMSQWRTGARAPAGDNVHKIAARLGPRIYDLVGQPRPLPTNPEIVRLADRWQELSEETREIIMELIDN